MQRREDSFRNGWSSERNKARRSDFHYEQQALRKGSSEGVEQEDDWFFNAPGKEDEEEAETV